MKNQLHRKRRELHWHYLFSSIIQEYLNALLRSLGDKDGDIHRGVTDGRLKIIPRTPSHYYSGGIEIKPDAWYYPEVAVFVPHVLMGVNPPCPVCNTTMAKKGWASNPAFRRVIGLSSSYYLLQYRYKCSNCRNGGKERTFNAGSPELLPTLPAWVSDSLPCILTKRSAIDREVKHV